MNIYIVRHGETDWNKKNLFQGSVNNLLNSNGRKQAEELAKNIKDINIDYIYSSPLKRAIQTANIINKYFNHQIIISNNIIERKLGSLEGKSMSELFDDNIFDNIWNIKDIDNSDYNVESLRQLFVRVYKFLNNIIQKYSDTNSNILIVSHGCTFIAMLTLLGKVDIKLPLYQTHIKTCEYFEICNPTISKYFVNKYLAIN